ncbi:hypothetical protein [Bacillus sp. FJAT-27445]|uniref:hypothetical protein n=1 Tax=Bacillus sp. FJAT-27445 TaxID=1679166 RepID=UPI000743E659|nr:hypothetical protein [Bacillus sp. FJAT-27445]
MTISPPNQRGSGINLNQTLIDSSNIHAALGQEILITTEDKLEICLRDHEKILKDKNDWVTPGSLLLSLITSLLTADFKNFIGVKPEIWSALFIIGSFYCFIWLLKSAFFAIKFRKSGDIKNIIQKIKSMSQNLSDKP